MTAYGPFFKRICSHTAAAGFAVTWIAGLCKQVTPERIFIRSLIAAALFWMLGAFITRYAFGPPPGQTRRRIGPAAKAANCSNHRRHHRLERLRTAPTRIVTRRA